MTLALLLLAFTPPPAENVLVVTFDGFRREELFTGADETLMTKEQGVKDVPGLKAKYWRATPAERRAALLPFLWGTMAKDGQVFGNPARKAPVRITNRLNFSYPGYSELFCGVADPRIDSNNKRDNPNLNVLEFLNGRPGFRGKVEVIGTWDVYPSIFRSKVSGLPVLAGWEPVPDEPALTETMNRLPRYWPDNVFDAITIGAARSGLVRRQPRVLYVALGETDEWGHGRRYDLYLDAAHTADRFLAETWAWLQSQPQYAGKTALLVTADHGRGLTRIDWTDHGAKVTGAEFIWAAAIGAGVSPLGERSEVETTQSQIAATVAKLVGEDFLTASPKAAAPLPLAAPTGK